MEPCPLCGAVAGVSRDEEMRYRCDVCGGPRVPLDAKGVKPSKKLGDALQRADRARKSRAKNRAGGVLAAVGLAGALGIIALIGVIGALTSLELGFGFVVGSLLATGPLSAIMAWLFMRARAAGRQIAPALDDAWLVAATDVVEQSKGPVTARSLAEALRIEEPQAEELVALLEAHDVVRGDGKLAFPNRMRIGAPSGGPSPTLDPLEAEAEAEAEAALEGRVDPLKKNNP